MSEHPNSDQNFPPNHLYFRKILKIHENENKSVKYVCYGFVINEEKIITDRARTVSCNNS